MQDLAVEEGGPAELLCQYSRPVQATWKMDEQEVCADGHRVIIEQDWTVARLSFRPALPRDSGIYSCEAAGTRVVALLQVQGEAAQRAAPAPSSSSGIKPSHSGGTAGSDNCVMMTVIVLERWGPSRWILPKWLCPEPIHSDSRPSTSSLIETGWLDKLCAEAVPEESAFKTLGR